MAVTASTGFSSVPKGIYKVTKDIASIAAVESADVEFAVPCDTGDTGIIVPVTAPTMGIVWTTGFCSTAGTMLFRFANVTAGAIDLASGDYWITVL